MQQILAYAKNWELFDFEQITYVGHGLLLIKERIVIIIALVRSNMIYNKWKVREGTRKLETELQSLKRVRFTFAKTGLYYQFTQNKYRMIASKMSNKTHMKYHYL